MCRGTFTLSYHTQSHRNSRICILVEKSLCSRVLNKPHELKSLSFSQESLPGLKFQTNVCCSCTIAYYIPLFTTDRYPFEIPPYELISNMGSVETLWRPIQLSELPRADLFNHCPRSGQASVFAYTRCVQRHTLGRLPQAKCA